MEKLPTEILFRILYHYDGKIATLAPVSRRWQAIIESRTLRHILVNHEDFHELSALFAAPERRRNVRDFTYIVPDTSETSRPQGSLSEYWEDASHRCLALVSDLFASRLPNAQGSKLVLPIKLGIFVTKQPELNHVCGQMSFALASAPPFNQAPQITTFCIDGQAPALQFLPKLLKAMPNVTRLGIYVKDLHRPTLKEQRTLLGQVLLQAELNSLLEVKITVSSYGYMFERDWKEFLLRIMRTSSHKRAIAGIVEEPHADLFDTAVRSLLQLPDLRRLTMDRYQLTSPYQFRPSRAVGSRLPGANLRSLEIHHHSSVVTRPSWPDLLHAVASLLAHAHQLRLITIVVHALERDSFNEFPNDLVIEYLAADEPRNIEYAASRHEKPQLDFIARHLHQPRWLLRLNFCRIIKTAKTGFTWTIPVEVIKGLESSVKDMVFMSARIDVSHLLTRGF